MKENCKPCCSKNKASKKGLHLLSLQWLKIKEKVSFNIASEASYVYISSNKKPKMVNFSSFDKLKVAVKQC